MKPNDRKSLVRLSEQATCGVASVLVVFFVEIQVDLSSDTICRDGEIIVQSNVTAVSEAAVKVEEARKQRQPSRNNPLRRRPLRDEDVVLTVIAVDANILWTSILPKLD